MVLSTLLDNFEFCFSKHYTRIFCYLTMTNTITVIINRCAVNAAGNTLILNVKNRVIEIMERRKTEKVDVLEG